jgi:hypothetical protein
VDCSAQGCGLDIDGDKMREVLARQMPDRFLVAFSFAGEERALIESLAIALEAQLGHGTVFYDAWYESYLAGWNADLRMQDIYEKKTELIVVGVSGSYGSKVWTQTEFAAVRALTMRLSASSETKEAMRVLPLRVGDGDVEGILLNTISPDVRDRGVEKTVELILSRLRLACPNAGKSPQNATPPAANRYVFLAI